MQIMINTTQCPCRTLNDECDISGNECYEDDICSTCPLIRNGGVKLPKGQGTKELNDIRQELLNRPDQYITLKDLVERFDYADAQFNHTPWNLLQIYTNFNVLIGKESERE